MLASAFGDVLLASAFGGVYTYIRHSSILSQRTLVPRQNLGLEWANVGMPLCLIQSRGGTVSWLVPIPIRTI